MQVLARIVLLSACLQALVACNGTHPPLPYADAQTAVTAALRQVERGSKAELVIRVKVPHRRHDRRMRPQYVSPSTQGMTVLLSGPTSISTTIGLKPSSPGCSQTTSGTTCTVSFALVPCPSAAKCYTGSIATYDAVQCRGSTCVIPPGANALSANE